MESEVLMMNLFRHVWLVHNKQRRVFKWRLKNYAEQMHNQIIALGKGRCPYCGMVL